MKIKKTDRGNCKRLHAIIMYTHTLAHTHIYTYIHT